MVDLLDFALHEAELCGASHAEAYLTRNKEFEVSIENNDMKQAKSQVSSSIGIRVLLNGGSVGFYSVNQMTKSKVSEAAAMAVKIAKISPRDKNNSLPSSTKEVRLLRGLYDRGSESFEASDAANRALEMLNAAKTFDPRVSVDSGNFGSSIFFHSIANSNGTRASERISIFYWSIMGMAIDGIEVSNFDVQSAGSHSVKDIDVTATALDFARTVIQSLHPRRIECFKGQMILTPASGSEIVGDVLAHSVNSESVQRRSSAFAQKLEGKVAAESLTVEDDATNAAGLAASSFDREGVGHRRNVVIEKGILKRFLYNTYTAKKDGVRSTGNAVGSSTSPPTVSTTNLIFSPGKNTFENLVSETDQGVIVNRFSGNVNAVSGDFSGVVKGGRYVSKGVVGEAVKEVMVAGNVFDSLRRLVGLSRERKVLYNMILPYMSFGGVSFTAG